jgi:hypothetical protein
MRDLFAPSNAATDGKVDGMFASTEGYPDAC